MGESVPVRMAKPSELPVPEQVLDGLPEGVTVIPGIDAAGPGSKPQCDVGAGHRGASGVEHRDRRNPCAWLTPGGGNRIHREFHTVA